MGMTVFEHVIKEDHVLIILELDVHSFGENLDDKYDWKNLI